MMLFGFFSLILILVYWINRAVALFDQLVSDGQSLTIFLILSVLSLPALIRIVLPIAAFAAVIYVTNRMSSESELVVLQATGTSPLRLARPVIVFGLVVGVLMAVLTNYLVPAAITDLNLRQADIARNATARFLREGQFISPVDGVTLYIREITPEGELRDVFLSDTRETLESVTYTAASAYVVRTERGPQLVMIDGMAQVLRVQTDRLITTAFEDLTYDIGAMIRLPDTTRRSSREVMTPDLLAPTPALMDETRRSAGQLVAEGHDRIAQALLPTGGVLLAFAIMLAGKFSRFGVWRQVVIAVFAIIALKLIESVVTDAVRGDAALWPLIYLPSVTGLAAGTGLLAWPGRRRALRAVPA